MDDFDFAAAFGFEESSQDAAPPVSESSIQEAPADKPLADSSNESANPDSSNPFTIELLFQEHLAKKSTPTPEDVIKWYSEADNSLTGLDAARDEDNERINKMLEALERIAFEVKAKHSRIASVQRQQRSKAGKTIWDRERRGLNPFNSGKLLHESDEEIRNQKAKEKHQKEQRKHKAKLNKMEASIKAMLDMGESEEDVIEMFTTGNKYSAEQVKGAIKRAKEQE